MKPILAFLLLLACGGIVLGSQTNPGTSGKPVPLLAELVQMTKAGASDVELLAYAKAHRRELPPEVNDQDIEFLRESGVSERVVRYMTAIDVRVSGHVPQEDSASASGEVQSPPPRPNDSYPQGESMPYDGESGDYVGNDPGGYAYPDSYAYTDNYAGNYYAGNYCDPVWGYGCSYGYYPYYSYPYTFFAFQPFHPFHNHAHHFHDGHGSNGNRWRGKSGGATANARVASRNDAWRQRSFNGGNAGMRRPAALSQRGSARTVFARQGMGSRPGATSRMLSSRGFGSSGPARGGFAGGSRAPQANFGNRGGFSRPAISSGMRGSANVGHPSSSGGGMHAGGGARGGGGRH